MKKHLLVLVCLFFVGLVLGQDVEYSNNLLARYNEIKQHSHNAALRQGHHHRECLTPIFAEAKRNYALLTEEAKTVFRIAASRPALSSEQTHATTHFLIHYTKLGVNAVPSLDVNSNNIPDFVETMGVIFEDVWLANEQTYGYPMPPTDGPIGGNSKYDIYISDIGVGLYGYVMSENVVGDNPNSPGIIEKYSCVSYMAMNNDYTFAGGDILTAVKATAAHEFFHAIQFGLNVYANSYFMESTATWMEDVVYPDIDDNLQYLRKVFEVPDVAIDLDQREDPNSKYPGHYYGAWIFWKYIQERTDVDIVRDIWIRVVSQEENFAINEELKERGTNFETIFQNFTIANLVMESDATFDPYTYLRADVYAPSRPSGFIEGSIEYNADTIVWKSKNQGNKRLMRLSADYFHIVPEGNFTLTFIPDNASKGIVIHLVKYNSNNNDFEVQKATLSGTMQIIAVQDQADFTDFYAIISRFDQGANSASEQYVMSIAPDVFIPEPEPSPTKIYPQPASDKFYLEYLFQSPVQLEVFDISGQLVCKRDLAAGEKKHLVYSYDLKNGIYFIMIKDGKSVLVKERIIISN